MDYNEEKFKEHIKAVVEASEIDNEIGDRALTLDELKELAISMGVTEEGWKKLLEQAETHLKAADDNLKARSFKEAINEGEKATAINPYIANGNSVLAKAYMMLWLDEQDEELRKKAEFHARQELKVDPRDMAAINVLATIEKKSDLIEHDQRSRKLLLIGSAAAVALVIIIVLLMVLPSASANDPINTEKVSDGVKNQLIEAEEDVKLKWDQVLVAIDQRNDMLPELFRAVEGSHEDLDLLQSAIRELQDKIDKAHDEERFKLENNLNEKVSEARTLASQYADSQNIEKLLMQIEGCENRIAFEKKNYNEAVKHYNILVKQHQDDYPSYQVKPYFSE